MDKMPLGGYVKVIGTIFLDSLKPLAVVVVLLLGFIMAFRNRAHFKGGEEYYSSDNSSFETVDFFNGSLAYSFPLIYSMMAGSHQVEDMGVDNLTWPNLINFIICLFFLFVISTLAFNIFTGIAIDEIRNLIADSNMQITKDKISYTYESSIFDGTKINSLYKKFSDIVYPQLSKVYLLSDLVSYVTDFCLNKLYGKSKQVNPVNENKYSQDIMEAYEDDKYSEHFETLEETIKNKNENIEKNINQLIESIAKLASEQKESMAELSRD